VRALTPLPCRKVQRSERNATMTGHRTSERAADARM